MDQQTFSQELQAARRRGDTQYASDLKEAASSGTLGEMDARYSGRMDPETYDALTEQAREQGDTDTLQNLQSRAEQGEVVGRGARSNRSERPSSDGDSGVRSDLERTVESMRKAEGEGPFVRQLASCLDAGDVEAALQGVREDRQGRDPEAAEIIDDILGE